MLASFRLWFWCWLRLLRCWMGTYSRDCFTLTSSEIVSDFNTWKWLNFSSELMLKSLKTKDAKKCKLIQQKKWFVLVALVVAKMLARVTQERIHLSKPSTDPWVWQFESVFVRSSILKKVDHWSANITVASFLPVLHLGELAVHEQNILGNGPKVFYAFTDIWIIDIIRII